MSQPAIYDLHCHTTASDGLLSPEQVIARAVANQVTTLAITDHDTTDGLAAAHHYLQTQQLPLQLINGVEISTAWQQNDIHVVALNIDRHSEFLQALLTQQAQYRLQRGQAIAERLARQGIKEAYQQAAVYAKGEILSRSHFARFLVDHGYVKDIKAAFKRYLGKGKSAYVPPMWCTIAEAVAVIHQAGGVAVLAHPLRYDLTNSKLQRLLTTFKEAGGDAIEVSQSRQTQDDFYRLAKLAIDYQFYASLGSDFHALDNYLDLGKVMPLSANVTPVWQSWQSVNL